MERSHVGNLKYEVTKLQRDKKYQSYFIRQNDALTELEEKDIIEETRQKLALPEDIAKDFKNLVLNSQLSQEQYLKDERYLRQEQASLRKLMKHMNDHTTRLVSKIMYYQEKNEFKQQLEESK